MERFLWSKLNSLQVGRFSEYFVKMEFAMYGFQVYTSEVDDRGIDLVIRYEQGSFYTVQVKSLRDFGYVFMPKSKFPLHNHLYLAFGLLFDGKEPDLFLIPSQVWLTPDSVFVDREFKGLKSPPEWGINISRRNMPRLKEYLFSDTIEKIMAQG